MALESLKENNTYRKLWRAELIQGMLLILQIRFFSSARIPTDLQTGSVRVTSLDLNSGLHLTEWEILT